MRRTNIKIDESLVRKARKLTRLRTTSEIVDRALKLLVRSEGREGILKYYGSGIWQGDAKRIRERRKWSTYWAEGAAASEFFMEEIE